MLKTFLNIIGYVALVLAIVAIVLAVSQKLRDEPFPGDSPTNPSETQRP